MHIRTKMCEASSGRGAFSLTEIPHRRVEVKPFLRVVLATSSDAPRCIRRLARSVVSRSGLLLARTSR